MVLQYLFLVNYLGHDSHIHPMGLISYYWVVKFYISPVVRSTLNPRTTKKGQVLLADPLRVCLTIHSLKQTLPLIRCL